MGCSMFRITSIMISMAILLTAGAMSGYSIYQVARYELIIDDAKNCTDTGNNECVCVTSSCDKLNCQDCIDYAEKHQHLWLVNGLVPSIIIGFVAYCCWCFCIAGSSESGIPFVYVRNI